jgi:hypothetical protein
MKSRPFKIGLASASVLAFLFSLASCGTTATTTMTATQTTTTTKTATTTVSTPGATVVSTLAGTTVTTTAPPVTSMITTTYATMAYANVIPTGSISVTGYITTEDDFASGKGADTAYMINMSKMAASGLGITRQGTDGKWVFYYFSGTFSGSAKVNGVWTFNGTGAQLDAFNLVLAQYNKVQMAPVPATIVGVLKGDTATNTGIDADGFYFSVITVTSITAG